MQKLSYDQVTDMWTRATIEMCTPESCYRRGVADAEQHHGNDITPIEMLSGAFAHFNKEDLLRAIIKAETATYDYDSTLTVVRMREAYKQLFGEAAQVSLVSEFVAISVGMSHDELYTMYEDYCSEGCRDEIIGMAKFPSPEPVRDGIRALGHKCNNKWLVAY